MINNKDYLLNNFERMSKKTLVFLILGSLLFIGLGVGGYFLWDRQQKLKRANEGLQGSEESARIIAESVAEGTLPAIGTNPMENKPDVNPVDQTNPFKNIKTNPFE